MAERAPSHLHRTMCPGKKSPIERLRFLPGRTRLVASSSDERIESWTIPIGQQQQENDQCHRRCVHPRSPSVLKVQRVVDGKTQEYEVQEDVENAIQQECEIRFSLVHSAPIMMTLLGERLRYLSDKALARAIITKTYNIPSDMDPATKLILEEIGNLGVKLINGEGMEIVITPEDFK